MHTCFKILNFLQSDCRVEDERLRKSSVQVAAKEIDLVGGTAVAGENNGPALVAAGQRRFKNGIGTFFGDTMLNGKPVRVRFIWSQITPTSARWEQAYSADGWKDMGDELGHELPADLVRFGGLSSSSTHSSVKS